MNIALIGAPGSGKTEFAHRLAERLATHDPSCGCTGRTVEVIDGYVPEIEGRIEMALGPLADYLGNLYVALERYARERRARLHNDIVISCGTIIETAVYVAMHFYALSKSLTAEEMAEAAPRMDAVLRILAVLYADVCKYDYGFYLPPQPKDEPDEFDEDWLHMDRQLQAGLGGFKLIPVTALTDPETQLEDALAALEHREVPTS